ncbi:hypothetical protein BSKO_12781 [Bryopsis sp. KO-2023]|nr:hypothetical protein BSKO_12781 [Bryopsis sp. KO-2023]
MGGKDPSSEVKGQEKGPAWAIYQHVFPGRKIYMNNRKGVVIGVSKSILLPLHAEELPPYLVQFRDVEEGAFEVVNVKDIMANILDEFDEGPYTALPTLELQKRNWEADLDSESENENCRCIVISSEEDEDEENLLWDDEAVTKLSSDDEAYMLGPDGYAYSKEQAFTEGDIPLDEWISMEFDSDTEWEVESIVRHRRDSRGHMEYLVKYKGFELNPGDMEAEGDWQTQAGVECCLELVNEYMKGLAAASENPLCIYSNSLDII